MTSLKQWLELKGFGFDEEDVKTPKFSGRPISTDEAAIWLSKNWGGTFSSRDVRDLLREGLLKGRKSGRRWITQLSALKALLDTLDASRESL